jgi:hypothetical protein
MNCRGIDHEVGLTDKLRSMRGLELQTFAPQAFHLLRFYFVRSRDMMPKGKEECSNAAHSRTGNADKMNPPWFVAK